MGFGSFIRRQARRVKNATVETAEKVGSVGGTVLGATGGAIAGAAICGPPCAVGGAALGGELGGRAGGRATRGAADYLTPDEDEEKPYEIIGPQGAYIAEQRQLYDQSGPRGDTPAETLREKWARRASWSTAVGITVMALLLLTGTVVVYLRWRR